ncbi:MAG: hypothetical protein ACQERS_04395 [Bacteroidota bacterium]
MAFTLEIGSRAPDFKLKATDGNVKWEGKDAHWMPPDACDLV